jgi:predicted acetyltransferase
MRHELNDHTRIEGGHIGYYIRSSARRKGYATKALSSALKEIALLGVIDVMLTTTPENTASIRVIERNGGILKAQVSHPNGRDTINQYWIALP